MPYDKAERKHYQAYGYEQQKRLRRSVEGEKADQSYYRTG